MGLGNGTGDGETSAGHLQRGVSQNVFPNNRDRAIESEEIFQLTFRPSK